MVEALTVVCRGCTVCMDLTVRRQKRKAVAHLHTHMAHEHRKATGLILRVRRVLYLANQYIAEKEQVRVHEHEEQGIRCLLPA